MKDTLGHARPSLSPGKIPSGRQRVQCMEWDVENIYGLLDQLNSMLLDAEARLHQLDGKRYQGKLPHTEAQHGS